MKMIERHESFRAGEKLCFCLKCRAERHAKAQFVKTLSEERIYALRERMRNC